MQRCPDCKRYFPAVFRNDKGEDMLPDILKHNPNVLVLCQPCGMQVEYFHAIARKNRLHKVHIS